MQTAALSLSSTPLLRYSKNLRTYRSSLLRLRPVSAAPPTTFASFSSSHGLLANRHMVYLTPLSDRRPKEGVAVRATSVPDRASSGYGAADGRLLQTLQLGSLFGLWYLFNIYNKQVPKVFPFPRTIKQYNLLLEAFLSCLCGSLIYTSDLRFLLHSLLPSYHWLSFTLFTNMSLGKVAVSFTHTIKAMEPFFSVLLSAFFLGEMPTVWVLISLVPIVGGVALASLTEASFNWAGFWSAMASNLTFQSHNVLSKKVMVKKEEALDNINLFSIITIMSFLLLSPATLFVEGLKVTPSYLQSAGLDLNQIYIRSLLAALCFHAYHNETIYTNLDEWREGPKTYL